MERSVLARGMEVPKRVSMGVQARGNARMGCVCASAPARRPEIGQGTARRSSVCSQACESATVGRPRAGCRCTDSITRIARQLKFGVICGSAGFHGAQ